MLHLPEINNRLSQEGATVVGNTPEQYQAIIRADIEKWAKIIKALGLRAN